MPLTSSSSLLLVMVTLLGARVLVLKHTMKNRHPSLRITNGCGLSRDVARFTGDDCSDGDDSDAEAGGDAGCVVGLEGEDDVDETDPPPPP